MTLVSPAASAYEKFLRSGNISYLYQMDTFDWVVVSAYFIILAILSFYGLHRYMMVFLYRKNRDKEITPKSNFEELPRVTVQLPAYNEMYVMERIIDAVCAFDYPHDKLDIQVLDDSTDETVEIARKKVAEKAAEGFDIQFIHRTDRTGYKAGALDEGLRVAKGDLIAIFDADFVPGDTFLRDLVPALGEGPRERRPPGNG